MPIFHEEEQNKKLAEIHTIQEEAAVKSLADDYGVSYIDLGGVGINTDALLLISEEISRSVGIACFAMVGKKLSVAVQSPTKIETIEQVDLLEQKGFIVQMFLVSVRSLEKAWARYADVSGALLTRGGLLDISDEELQKLAETIHTNADIRDQFNAMIRSGETHKISKLMEIIFGASIATHSSDVHIEAAENNARLRFRQDGVLQDIVEFPLDVYKSINSRIKLLSELKLTDTVLAQDGRFTIFYKKLEIEVRVSLIPGPYGESIVMRILNPEGLAKDFESLGMQRKLLEVLLVEIEKPNGMILNTGPTGSGKTTTLYSILKRVYTPEIKILTIEDPIEYHLPGITQTQIDHDTGYDFSAGLRAAMRQDPDVIMVGEIRDKETASTAINASLTGHLVLSTLHTNNAAGAIPRLTELGVSKSILPDALTVVMAQRMIRRLCEHCKVLSNPDENESTILRAVVANALHNRKDFSDSGISNAQTAFQVYKPVGCDKCDHIGYKGRIGIFEAILVDDRISEIIETNPSEREIKHGSVHQGIFTMVEDGVAKILAGITTMDEVQSTVDMVEDLPEGWNTPEFISETFIAPTAPVPTMVSVPIIEKPEPAVVMPSRLPASVPVRQSIISEPQPVYQQSPINVSATIDPMAAKMIQDIPNLIKQSLDEWEHKHEIERKKISALQKSMAKALHVPQPHVPPIGVPDKKPVQPAPTFVAHDLAFFPVSDESGVDYTEKSNDSGLPARELSMMIEYLQFLENEQKSNPEIGIKNKISEVKEIIIGLIKQNPVSQWTRNESKTIHDDVASIIKQLEVVEDHQSKRPNIGVAQQLRDIRNTIENILVKE